MKELRINIITNNNQYGLTSDAGILVRYLQQISESRKRFRFRVCPVHFYCAECGRADINIHLEIPCPLLIHSAPVNILVPNHEWWFRHWKPYLKLFDEVWVKTETALHLFQEQLKDTPDAVRLIEWTSPDRRHLDTKMEWDQMLHLAGRSRLKGTVDLIAMWKPEWPTLHVVHNAESVPLDTSNLHDNIIYYPKRLSDGDLCRLMNRCGVHLCPSRDEGYGHYLNEARSCGALVVTLDAPPMSQFTEAPFRIPLTQETVEEMKQTLGTHNRFTEAGLTEVMDRVLRLSSEKQIQITHAARAAYIEQGRRFRGNLEEAMNHVLSWVDKPPCVKLPIEIQTRSQDLPTVTLVTISRDRPQFLPLAILNYTGVDYPRELLKWVVVDANTKRDESGEAGDTCSVSTTLRKELQDDMEAGRVLCIKGDPSYTVAQNRNLGIAAATSDYVAMMDDDDIYPPRHLLIKYAYLSHYGKSCGYCTNIGCFHIGKYISTINVPPMNYPPEQRVSEATLFFRKSFWEARGFCEEDHGEEGAYFLRDRYGECVEYPWKPMLISLLHRYNLSNRVRGIGNTPNGCHFGISDELFSFVTSLEERDSCVESYLQQQKEGRDEKDVQKEVDVKKG